MRSTCLLAAAILLLAVPPCVRSQAEGRISNQEAGRLMTRILDLLEANRIVMPELSMAGAPLQENFRHGLATLRTTVNARHTGILYGMLTNAKAYLQLSDTLPKPPDFSEDAARQLSQLRAAVQTFDAYFRSALDAREEQALGADRDNLRRYADANSTVGPAERAEVRVVFLGDSITDGWALAQYFTGKSYLNRGISGQTTGQMLGRTRADVLELQPKVVIVLGGTNDLARGVPDSAIRHNLEAIGTLAQAAGIVPVMSSILPVNDYREGTNPRFRRTSLRSPSRIAGLNQWLSGLCSSKRWVYLDYHGAMVDDSGQLREGLSDDGLHPNSEGYKIMAPLVEQAVDSAARTRLSRLL